mmetsp:Transcript_7719/g.14080  ORF Transcript_7719/g.14080 Transcript_7719/m.14080 type:complete len:217 (-) Transcript_7719:249-899(-)
MTYSFILEDNRIKTSSFRCYSLPAHNGTPASALAIDIPRNIYAKLKHTLNVTRIPTATGLEQRNRFWIPCKALSKYLEMYTDKARRAGRITFRNAKKAAYTATKPFHCPGAKGDRPVFLEAMYQAQLTHVIPNTLDTNPYDSNTLPPSLAREALSNFSPRNLANSPFFVSPVPIELPSAVNVSLVVKFDDTVWFVSRGSRLSLVAADRGSVVKTVC